MTIQALREICSRLNVSATALAAVGTVLNARVTGNTLDPKLEPHLVGTLAALGAEEAIRDVTEEELRPLLAEIRTFTLTNAKLLSGEPRGWRHSEPELLQAAGDVSAAFPHVLKSAIVPELDGLAARLELPGASFLDVGVGVAALAIEMARLFPSLRVVGIDLWAPALALGRENVRTAGLGARIELREQAGQELSDTNAFDLAWVPGLFVPEQAIADLVRRVASALKPGGWLVFATLKRGPDPLASAVSALRTAQFGGSVSTPEHKQALLNDAGFGDVRILPSSPASLTAMLAARRPAPR